MPEFIELLSRLLGVSIPAMAAALLVYVPVVELLKKVLPTEFTLFGRVWNTGLVLAFVVGLLAGGYAQYAVVAPDGLTLIETLSIAWGGFVAFALGAGWYAVAKGEKGTTIINSYVTEEGVQDENYFHGDIDNDD